MFQRNVVAAALAALSFAASAQVGGVITPHEAVKPVESAKPISVTALEALQGDGIYYFNGRRMVNLRIAQKVQGDQFAVTETSSDIDTTTFNTNIDVRHFVRNGERQSAVKPTYVVVGKDGTAQLVYAKDQPLYLDLTIQAYDVSGLPIAAFLRTTDNYTKSEARAVGDAKFPAGSIAYLSSVNFRDDTLMLPNKESFTGAANTRQMLTNFSKSNPYCLSYDDRKGAQPYAMFFRDTGATKGKVELFAAKPGTMFCAAAGDKPLAEGTWEERTVGGTKAIVLSFSANVDPLDTGVNQVEKQAAQIAFIEPKAGAPGVRPGKLYKSGARIADYQYRFNSTAAEAVKTAFGM